MAPTRIGTIMLKAVTVRHPTAQDRDAWLEMRQSLWPECPQNEHVAEIDETIAGKGQTAFVAELQNGHVCGFLEASLRPFANGCETKPVGYIEGWYVLPDCRRQGVGRALVAAAEGWALEQGCVEMASDAIVSNTESQKAHAAIGYGETDRIVCFTKRLSAGDSTGRTAAQ